MGASGKAKQDMACPDNAMSYQIVFVCDSCTQNFEFEIWGSQSRRDLRRRFQILRDEELHLSSRKNDILA